MKKKLILMLLAGCIVLNGCGAKENSESHQNNGVEEKEEFQLKLNRKLNKKSVSFVEKQMTV